MSEVIDIKAVKKFFSVVSAFLIVCVMQSLAFASSAAEIYAESITAVKGETVLIPVKIKNNSGIMGFKITVTYDREELQSPTVNRGTLTRSGNFNDSIGVAPDGAFDVVWSDTKNAIDDGTLMILGFKATEITETSIKLSFSQLDTFNEAWEDVVLNCKEITVSIVDYSETVTTKSEQNSSDIEESDTEEIKSAVDIVLNETGKGNLEEIDEDEEADFINRVNDVLGQLNEYESEYFADIGELKTTYDGAVADEFVESVKASADSDKTEAAINDALESVKAETIEDIPEKKKTEFIKAVEANLGQNISDFDTISDKLTADDAVEAIKRLQSENVEEATQGVKIPVQQNKNNTTTVMVIIAAVVILAAITTIIVVYINRKSKNKEAKTNEENI